MFIGLHVKYLLLYLVRHMSVKLEFFRQIFEKYSNIEFNENRSGGSRAPCGWTDGQTDRNDEAHSRFSQFTVVLKNGINSFCYEDRVMNVISDVA
jgi:hypothetical protein